LQIGLPATSNNFDFCCERALRRLASFQKFVVFHPILLASEALPSIRKFSFSLRNQLFEVASRRNAGAFSAENRPIQLKESRFVSFHVPFFRSKIHPAFSVRRFANTP